MDVFLCHLESQESTQELWMCIWVPRKPRLNSKVRDVYMGYLENQDTTLKLWMFICVASKTNTYLWRCESVFGLPREQRLNSGTMDVYLG